MGELRKMIRVLHVVACPVVAVVVVVVVFVLFFFCAVL